MLQTLNALIKQRYMRDVQIIRQAVGINRKAVILAGDFNHAGSQFLDRMISPAMPAFHFECLGTKSFGNQLMPDANPEYRNAAISDAANMC